MAGFFFNVSLRCLPSFGEQLGSLNASRTRPLRRVCSRSELWNNVGSPRSYFHTVYSCLCCVYSPTTTLQPSTALLSTVDLAPPTLSLLRFPRLLTTRLVDLSRMTGLSSSPSTSSTTLPTSPATAAGVSSALPPQPVANTADTQVRWKGFAAGVASGATKLLVGRELLVLLLDPGTRERTNQSRR